MGAGLVALAVYHPDHDRAPAPAPPAVTAQPPAFLAAVLEPPNPTTTTLPPSTTSTTTTVTSPGPTAVVGETAPATVSPTSPDPDEVDEADVERDDPTTTTTVVDEVEVEEPTTTTTIAVAEPVHPGGGWADLRECESGGDYTAVQHDGPGRGAYQFDQPTWDGIARHLGRSDLVGVPPHTAAPADQDTAAVRLYDESGNVPWPYCGRYL